MQLCETLAQHPDGNGTIQTSELLLDLQISP